MTKEEAIKFLQQLYPNGGHCWLDEQRIEAIGMAIKALQEEPVSDDLEEAAKQSGYAAYPVDMAEEFGGVIRDNNRYQRSSYIKGLKAGANWQKQQMMKNAIDTVVKVDAGGYPYVDRTIELYDYDREIPLAKKGDKVKLIVIKEE